MNPDANYRLIAFAAALAAGAALCTPAFVAAEDLVKATDSGMTSASKPMPQSDLAFFEKAAQDGKTEIEAAKIAETRTADPAIKRFAQKMVVDHGKAGDELKALAAKKGVTLPATLDDEHKAMLDKLQKASADDFDDTYSDMMHGDHDKAVSLFSDTAKNSRDPDIKLFASKTLPTLKTHQMLAEKLDSQH